MRLRITPCLLLLLLLEKDPVIEAALVAGYLVAVELDTPEEHGVGLGVFVGDVVADEGAVTWARDCGKRARSGQLLD